jgi:hypothetical protein
LLPKLVGLVLGFFCQLPTAHCQLVTEKPPQGRFLTDSLLLGLPVQYALSYRHPVVEDVFFPDSTHDFSPFQLLRRQYFPTRTNRQGSLDSVVYTLVSFEIEPVQRLSLPVYRYNGRDCTAVWARPDSVVWRQLIRGKITAGTRLRTDAQVRHLNPRFNYPYALLVGFGLLVGGGLIYGLFGQALRRQWRLYQMQRRHGEFMRSFQRLSRGITARTGTANVERAMVLWKKYLERVERRPVTSLTTRELIGAFPDPRLPDALRQVDATVYGGVFSPQVQSSLHVLRELAVRRYRQRRREAILAGRK